MSTRESVGFAAAALSLYLGLSSFSILWTAKWLVLACVLICLSLNHRVRNVAKAYCLGALGVVAICLMSAIHSAQPSLTAQLVLALTFVFSTGALLLAEENRKVGRKRGRSRRISSQVENLSWGFVLLGLFYFVPGLLCLLLEIERPPWHAKPLFSGLEEGWSVRYAGTLGNPNQIGICAAVLMPVVFAKAMEQPARRKLCWVLLGIMLFSVWHSGSRGGLLSSVIGIVVVVTLSGHANRILRFGMVVLVVGMIWVMNHSHLKEYFTRSPEKNLTIEEAGENRISRWEVGLKSIKKRPAFGQGYGVGGVPKSGYIQPHGVDTGYALHNSYLSIIQEVGVIGLLVVLVVLGAGIAVCFLPNRWTAADAPMRYNFAGFAGVVVAGSVSAFFESWLLAPGNLGTVPYWTSMCLVLVVHASARSWRPAARVGRKHPKVQVSVASGARG